MPSKTETKPALSAAAFKTYCKTTAQTIAQLAIAETRATVALGVALLEAYATFVAQGKDRETFLTWAMNVSGKGRSSCWNALKAAETLPTLPESAASLAVESLTKLAQVKPEDRAAVLKSAGKNPTTATIASKVETYHETHRSDEAKTRQNERQRKALDGLVKKLRDPLTTILANDPDPIALLSIGAMLGVKHAKQGQRTVVDAVKVVAEEFYRENEPGETGDKK